MSTPSSAALQISAPAKVNVYLGVGPGRADGFHSLATVFLGLSITDDVTVAAADDWSLTINSAEQTVTAGAVPAGPENLMYQAAVALADHCGVQPHAAVTLHKQIPVAAGLAGGSADAAATLRLLNDLWQTGCSEAELAEIGASLGSDIPFSLRGGAAVGTGRGEQLHPVDCPPQALWWVLVVSTSELSAGAVYAEFDRLAETQQLPEPQVPEELLVALAAADAEGVAMWMHNDLEAPAVSLMPGLRSVLASGRESGALAGVVSGSGPTVALLANGPDHANQIADVMRSAPGVRTCVVASGATQMSAVTIQE